MLTRRAACATLLAPLLNAQPRKPNLIVILADDMGYGDIGCYGSPDVPTPNIDALARSGVRFTDGYVSCAVCSPSRVALLTGQYQHRHGHEFNSGPPEREGEVGFGVPASARLLPQHLKPSGYVSGAFGKWHLGVRAGYHPLDRGFDEFFGFLTGGNAFINKRTPGARAVASDDATGTVPEERPAPIYRNREIIADDRYLTDAFGAEAIAFIQRHKARPFFLYLAPNAIHTPLHATVPYLDRVASIRDAKHRHLAAMTVALDDAVGAVVKKVRAEGLENDTLIVFLSDNGSPTQTGAGTNAPLNGQKVTYYEGGIRVPFMMSWPGRIPAGKLYREPVVSRDIVPTFLTAASVRSETPFDGVDLLPFLDGRKKSPPHDALFWRGGQALAVRRGKWKLVEFGPSFTKLYDLEKDLGEKNELSAQRPNIVRQLRVMWQNWSSTMKAAAWPPRYRKVSVNGVEINWEL